MQVPYVELIIDGRTWAGGGGEAILLNPATGLPLARVSLADETDVDRAVRSAYQAFVEGPWSRMNPRDRARLLLRLADQIRQHHEELVRLESQNVGKPIREAREEVQLAADCFEYYAGTLGKVGGQTIPVAAPGISLTFREPLGVCALIVPWNFPLQITAWKVAPALAMGNTVVVKPASWTPLTALRLAELALEVGFPPGVLNVITGPGGTVGEALIRHPLVRKISFTGSTETGIRVMQLAATDLKRITLELGGKSANIVFADADLEQALHGAVWSVLSNAGQDCCARSRLLLEKSIYETFLERLVDRFRQVRLGDPLDETTEMGPLISAEHRQRVCRYIAVGLEEGATLLYGGDIPTDPPLDRGFYLRPALFANVSSKMRIAQEEIFGPVLCVLPFRTEEEAVALANDTSYGLSGSIWTRDIGRALRVARALQTGVLSINSSHSVHLEAPFGGVKRSGIGRELGLVVLDYYSEWKSVFIKTDI
jgi:betaine-aldehyde dehydrogenase